MSRSIIGNTSDFGSEIIGSCPVETTKLNILDIMNKIVVNKCYGGFSISKEAALWLLDHGFEDESLVGQLNNTGWDSFYPDIARHHPLLIQCVEELEDNANGCQSNLKIEEINSDFYIINNYDGYESIRTIDDIDWINCKEL